MTHVIFAKNKVVLKIPSFNIDAFVGKSSDSKDLSVDKNKMQILLRHSVTYLHGIKLLFIH